MGDQPELGRTRSSTRRLNRVEEEGDDVNNNNKNSSSRPTITAPEDGSRPVPVSQFGMQLRSSTTRTTVGSSGAPTQQSPISGNRVGTSRQGPVRKRTHSQAYGSNSGAVLPTNRAVPQTSSRVPSRRRPMSSNAPLLNGSVAPDTIDPLDTIVRLRTVPMNRAVVPTNRAVQPMNRAVLPTNRAVQAPARPKKQFKVLIDWDARDGPPELFDENGDRQSLACSGGKRPKANQLPPPTYLWNIDSTLKVESFADKDKVNVDTTVDVHRRLRRRLCEKDLRNYEPTTGECQICSNEHTLLVIPQCPCRVPCCHLCMFRHLEASYTRGQDFLCPFCQQAPDILCYNIKSPTDYRYWIMPKFEPYSLLYQLIRAIGLLAYENSEVCVDGVSPLRRITYASFVSTVMRGTESDYSFKLTHKQWFRAFVYIHDLIPWNYSAAQCTLPLPLCDEQAQHELTRLKDFLGAELCYFYSTLILPEDFERAEGVKMNLVLAQMRTIVNRYRSVQEYFERGEHFQKALTKLLPNDWLLNDELMDFNINVPKKIYTESLHFLNSRAPSLDTYIKRVIYTNTPSDRLIYDPCPSRQDSRMLRIELLEASYVRLSARLEEYKQRLLQRRAQLELAQQERRLSDNLNRLPGQAQDEDENEDENENENENEVGDEVENQNEDEAEDEVENQNEDQVEDNNETDNVANNDNNPTDLYYNQSGHPIFRGSYANIRPHFHVRFAQNGSRDAMNGTTTAHRGGYFLISHLPELHFTSLTEVGHFLHSHPEVESDSVAAVAVVHNDLPVRLARSSGPPGGPPIETDDSQLQWHFVRNIPFLTFESISQIETFYQMHPEAMIQGPDVYVDRIPSNVVPQYERPLEPTQDGQNVRYADHARTPWADWSIVPEEPTLANVEQPSAVPVAANSSRVEPSSAVPVAANSSRVEPPSNLSNVIHQGNGSSANPTRNPQSREAVTSGSITSRTRAPQSNSLAANDEGQLDVLSHARHMLESPSSDSRSFAPTGPSGSIIERAPQNVAESESENQVAGPSTSSGNPSDNQSRYNLRKRQPGSQAAVNKRLRAAQTVPVTGASTSAGSVTNQAAGSSTQPPSSGSSASSSEVVAGGGQRDTSRQTLNQLMRQLYDIVMLGVEPGRPESVTPPPAVVPDPFANFDVPISLYPEVRQLFNIVMGYDTSSRSPPRSPSTRAVRPDTPSTLYVPISLYPEVRQLLNVVLGYDRGSSSPSTAPTPAVRPPSSNRGEQSNVSSSSSRIGPRLGPSRATSTSTIAPTRTPLSTAVARTSTATPTAPSSSSSFDDDDDDQESASSSVGPITEELPTFFGRKAKKLKTACNDKGPGYQYFMRQIYPEESDGDSDSEDDDDEYITMRGSPSQWRRAKRSNRMRNGSSPSGSANRQDHIKSSVSPGLWIASTSGLNSRQEDQILSRDGASNGHLEYSDSDSD